tara:strand:- start:108 stop:338 length:231 start_codon:yes stop_codon:yes gene_type:complete
MKTPDLRHRLERPDECIEHLGRELIKTATKKSKAYKCWEEMLTYISYLEGKMDRKRNTIRQLKEKIDEQRGVEGNK